MLRSTIHVALDGLRSAGTCRAILPQQLHLGPTLERPVTQLKAKLSLKERDLLRFHDLAVAAKDGGHAPVSVADMRLADLLDTIPKCGRIEGPVVIGRALEAQRKRLFGSTLRGATIAPDAVRHGSR